MRSFDVCQCGAPLRLMERPTPAPAGTEVLLQVLAAGVCHSDLHVCDGSYDLGAGKRITLAEIGINLPLTLGHENVGRVVAFGPGAVGATIGDVRLVHPWMGCGECSACRRGEENYCRKPRNLGFRARGGYATHLVVPHPRYLFDIGDLAPHEAACLACSGLTSYGALKKAGRILTRELIVIIGAGGLGLMSLALLHAMGGVGAVVVDIDRVKRDAALQAGARAVVDGAAPDAAEQIKRATDGGAWAVIDHVGSTPTVELALACLVKGGKLIIDGQFGGEITIPTLWFPQRAIAIEGSYVGNLGEMSELLALVRRSGPPRIPIGVRPLADVNAALADLRAGKVVGRLVLVP